MKLTYFNRDVSHEYLRLTIDFKSKELRVKFNFSRKDKKEIEKYCEKFLKEIVPQLRGFKTLRSNNRKGKSVVLLDNSKNVVYRISSNLEKI